MEQIDYNLLFRWFVGLDMDARVWDASTFSRNRDRPIDAWALLMSFRPKDRSGDPPGLGRNSERSFHREKRSNETHASTTDPDARLFRKADGQASRLCCLGHALMENRPALIVDATLIPSCNDRDL